MGWFFSKEKEAERRLAFSKHLQAVTNKIHATNNLDQIMLDLSQDICALFNCDRFTLYALSKEKDFIYSKVKTGIDRSEDLVLKVNADSIAGYVAMSRRSIRVHDVYDEAELKKYAKDLKFSREVDRVTGYRTKQMLAAPLINEKSKELLGLIQLLNNRDDDSFTETAEESLQELCETMAIALTQRIKPAPAAVSSKYDPLIAEGIISAPEMELAARSARRQELDIEEVLIDEFQVKPASIGQALARSANLPYEAFRADRLAPAVPLKKISREFAEKNSALPIEDDGKSIIVMTTDPERIMRTGAVKQLFPYASLFYRVTTKRELRQTIDHFFGA